MYSISWTLPESVNTVSKSLTVMEGRLRISVFFIVIEFIFRRMNHARIKTRSKDKQQDYVLRFILMDFSQI